MQCLDLQKIDYPELCKCTRKLCTLYVRDDLICREIEYQELPKFNENCVHYMYETSGFA